MRVLLPDFGLAKVKNETKTTKTKEATMTVRWTAPEIFEGKRYAAECDVYSFGVFLWGAVVVFRGVFICAAAELATREVRSLFPSVVICDRVYRLHFRIPRTLQS